MMSELALVDIFRFDPKEGGSPRYETYEAPYKEMTVLDVIRYIYEHYDPTLSFRCGCDIGRCYGCLLLVNGVSVVACEKAAEARMRIEPLKKFQVIKDLVVDFDKLSEEKRVKGNQD